MYSCDLNNIFALKTFFYFTYLSYKIFFGHIYFYHKLHYITVYLTNKLNLESSGKPNIQYRNTEQTSSFQHLNIKKQLNHLSAKARNRHRAKADQQKPKSQITSHFSAHHQFSPPHKQTHNNKEEMTIIVL